MFTFPSYKLTCTWPSATAPWVVQGCCYRQAWGSFSVGAGELPASWPRALSLYASSLQHPVQWSSSLHWNGLRERQLLTAWWGCWPQAGQLQILYVMENPTSLPITSAPLCQFCPLGPHNLSIFPLPFDKSKGIKSYPRAFLHHGGVNGLSLGIDKGIVNLL